MSGIHADLVFVNGAVFTADATRRWARAVAVRSGRITAVGNEPDVVALIGDNTDVVDMAGRMLLPGFQDAHIHPVTSGLDLTRCDLSEVTSLDGALASIAGYAEAHPEEPWILGGGWAMDWFPGGVPSAETLERVVPDRPAFLVSRDGHGAWANRRALELAGIGFETPDPPDGRVERLGGGEPQGTLQEGAMRLMDRVVPAPTVADCERGLVAAQRLLLSLGITAWQDAAVTANVHHTYHALAGRGELAVDVVGALWWDRERGEEQVDELESRRYEAAPGYRPTTVKLMLDGVCENFTAAMLDPYLDGGGGETDNHGLEFIDPAALPRIVTRLDAAGFQVHFHAIGDRAVRSALDAVEAARGANPWSDARHHIAHIQVIQPDDLPRFRRLGVVANAQPFWAYEDGYQRDLTIPYLGPERSALQYPFRSLLGGGANLAVGSE
jgi:predicted amidohydrolase YtcJ